MLIASSHLLEDLIVMAAVVSLCISLSSFLAPLSATYQKAGFGIVIALSVAGLLFVGLPHRVGLLIHMPDGLLALAAFFGGLPALLPGLVAAWVFSGSQGGAVAGLAMGQALLSGAFGMILHGLRRTLAPTAMEITGLSCAAAFGLAFVELIEVGGSVGDGTETFTHAFFLFCTTLLSMTGVRREIARDQQLSDAQLLRTIVDALPDSLQVTDRAGRFMTANPAAAAFFGRAESDSLVGTQHADFFDEETNGVIGAHEQAVMKQHAPLLRDYPFTLRSGKTGWLSALKAPVLDDDGNLLGIVTLEREITLAKEVALQHVETEAILREAIRCMADAIVVLDESSRILLVNRHYSALFAQTETAIGRHVGAVLRRAAPLYHAPGEDAQGFAARILAMMRVEGRSELTLGPDLHLSMTVRRMAKGYRLVVLSDVSAAKAAEQAMLLLNNRLERLARIDEVTGLFNRRMTLMLIDVDHFKRYNDTYGHLAGDACLAAIGTCLTALADQLPLAIAARYGGEEFALVLPDIRRVAASSIADVVRRRIRDMAIPHRTSSFNVVTVSIGLVSGPMPSLTDASSYLSAADLALYRAKASGRDCAFSFHSSMLHQIPS